MKKKTKRRPRVIEDYAVTDDDGDWNWLPSTFEKYTVTQIERLKKRWSKRGKHVSVGMNAITDLYKRVTKLEKRK